MTLASGGMPLVVVNPTAPVGPWDVKPTPTGKIVLDFLKGNILYSLRKDLPLGFLQQMRSWNHTQRSSFSCNCIKIENIFHSCLLRMLCIRMPLGITYVAVRIYTNSKYILSTNLLRWGKKLTPSINDAKNGVVSSVILLQCHQLPSKGLCKNWNRRL